MTYGISNSFGNAIGRCFPVVFESYSDVRIIFTSFFSKQRRDILNVNVSTQFPFSGLFHLVDGLFGHLGGFRSGLSSGISDHDVDVHHLFKRGEQTKLCLTALVDGPLTTRQLALYIMKAKGLNQADKVLAKSIGSRLIHALGMLRRQRRVIATGRVKAALIWELPPVKTLV